MLKTGQLREGHAAVAAVSAKDHCVQLGELPERFRQLVQKWTVFELKLLQLLELSKRLRQVGQLMVVNEPQMAENSELYYGGNPGPVKFSTFLAKAFTLEVKGHLGSPA